jgi:hypothetical protein
MEEGFAYVIVSRTGPCRGKLQLQRSSSGLFWTRDAVESLQTLKAIVSEDPSEKGRSATRAAEDPG